MATRIHVYFRDLHKTKNPAAYLKAKYKGKNTGVDTLSLLSTPDWDDLAKNGSVGDNEAPPLATPETVKNAKAILKKYAKALKCMIEEVNDVAPLAKGEKVKKDGDVPAYLKESWRGFPANTVVLERSTNEATLYFIYEHLRLEDGELVEIPLSEEIRLYNDFAYAAAATGLNWAAGAQSLAKGLAGLAPPPLNVIGAALLDLVFPSSNSINWDSVYQQFQQIVTQSLTQQTLDETRAKIGGVISWLNTQYLILKNDPNFPREKLQEELGRYDTIMFVDVVSILMDERWELGGFPNFLVAAGTHLGILQERALVSPGNPKESAFAGSVKARASQFVNHINQTIPKIINARIDQVSGLKVNKETSYIAYPAVITTYSYYFEDAKTGYRSPNIGNSSSTKSLEKDYKDRANEQRNLYIANLRTQTAAEVEGNAFPVRNDWQVLVTDPIPIV